MTVSLLISGCVLLDFSARAQTSQWVGSTPGDSLIKTMLAIPLPLPVDFIRWNLTTAESTFSLDLNYGESQPNTLGFKPGDDKRTVKGTVAHIAHQKMAIQRFTSADKTVTFSLVTLNDNTRHLLTPDLQLMVGNGGWSYTLNRNAPESANATNLPTWGDQAQLTTTDADVAVYDGRSPCADIARNYHLPVSADCFKLKWRLALHRDPTTHLPTTYTLRKIQYEPEDTGGTWRIIKGTPTNPEAIVYQLVPEKTGAPLSFLVGDRNVLFFLNQNLELLTGNANFSYTLNRR